MGNYLYKYETPQSHSKWARFFRLFLVSLWGYWSYFFFIKTGAISIFNEAFHAIPSASLFQFVLGGLMLSALVIAFLLSFLLFSGILYVPYFVICIRDRQQDIYIRKGVYKWVSRCTIPLSHIKNVTLCSPSWRELYELKIQGKKYYRWVFQDFKTTNSSEFPGVCIDLPDGRRAFIDFDDLENFLPILIKILQKKNPALDLLPMVQE